MPVVIIVVEILSIIPPQQRQTTTTNNSGRLRDPSPGPESVDLAANVCYLWELGGMALMPSFKGKQNTTKKLF